MQQVLKVISLLLTYPDQELHGAIGELRAAIGKAPGISDTHRKLLDKLAENIGALDLYDAQERYVLLFDRTRSLSLHLFEHVHGESRDRGQAMVDLMAMYEADGLEVGAKELPDYLPLFLEFLSTKDGPEAADLLGQISHIVVAMRGRLKKRKSVYANAFAVLEGLASGKPDAALVRELLEMPEDDPSDLDALDSIWEEEAVTFGGNAGEAECGPDRLQRQMRAHQRKPEDGAMVQNG